MPVSYAQGGQLQVPAGFNDPNSMAMQQYLMSGAQQSPELDPYIQQFLSQLLQYPLTSKGEPEYYDVDTQNKLQNAMQDRQQSLFDPGNAAMTGGFSPGAFAPIVDEKQLDFPETGTLLVRSQRGGYQGQLAKLIMSGMSSAQAAATIQDMVTNPSDKFTDDERNEMALGLPQLPPDQISGRSPGIDWNAVQKEASNMESPFLAEQGIKMRAMDPSSGVIERNGKYFQTSETPSPTTDWFRKQGLDTPNTQYGPDYLRQNNADFAGIESMLNQGMGELGAARQTYTANEAERRRQADLARKFSGQDQAAMDRFGRGVQSGLQDYGQSINRDMLSTPAWGGGQHVGDPTVMPQLGQRTGTQNDRDARLAEAMTYFRNYGAEGRIGSTPESIRQALADYMSSAGREPMTDVPGHPGSTMVGSAGRGPGGGGGGGYQDSGGLSIAEPDNPIVNNLPGYINANRGPGVVTPDMQRAPSSAFGEATMPTLPGLPQLSAYGDPEEAKRQAMLLQIMGKMPMMGAATGRARRNLEQAGKALPQPVRAKQADALVRKVAYDKTHAAQLAYANAMLPVLLARRAGRTPFQDELMARGQTMRAVGSIG